MTSQKMIGIVGTGGMAAAMVRAMQTGSDFTPVGVLSGDSARAQSFAKHFGLPVHCSDSGQFLRTEGLDAVYVANRNKAHAGVARGAIDAGLPVLVEKPLTLTEAETRDLCSAAQAKGVFLMENLWTLTLPAYRALKDVANNPDQDGPRYLSFDFSLPVTPAVMPGLFDPVGGGVLLDRAVYGLAAAYDLLGPVTAIDARIVRNEAGLDMRASLQLLHENQAISILSVALDQGGRNDLVLTTGQSALRLTPGLAAEQLEITQFTTPEGPGDPWVGGGLGARLKRVPALRKLKARLGSFKSGFHSYGANIYHPVLAEFSRALDTNATESAMLPHDLSITVSRLIDMARAVK